MAFGAWLPSTQQPATAIRTSQRLSDPWRSAVVVVVALVAVVVGLAVVVVVAVVVAVVAVVVVVVVVVVAVAPSPSSLFQSFSHLWSCTCSRSWSR